MCGSKSNHYLSLHRGIYESANLPSKYVKKGLFFFTFKRSLAHISFVDPGLVCYLQRDPLISFAHYFQAHTLTAAKYELLGL